MNYKETLDYLYSQLPMYQRIGKAAYKANLSTTLQLMDVLDHPYKELKCVHVAGTNGKGTTSHLISAALQKAGYKVGLYTSPHLLNFRERIKINGKEIPKVEVTAFVSYYKEIIKSISPSFFEWTVGLAFDYFKKENVDYCVIEVGMGGRLDSTNVINPLLSIITNIGFDHTQFLGNTLEKIATEKAGIIKEGIPVVLGESNPNYNYVFESLSKEKKASFKIASKQITPSNFPAHSKFEEKNMKTAWVSLQTLKPYISNLSDETILKSFSQYKSLTNLMGRMQKVENQPLTICDTAHNVEGITILLKELLKHQKKIHFVLGFVNDKNVNKVLSLFPKDNSNYYFTQASIPRALNISSLIQIAFENNIHGLASNSVWEGYKQALSNAKNKDLIFVGGSTFVVADFLKNKLGT